MASADDFVTWGEADAFTLLGHFTEDVAYTFQSQVILSNNSLERGKCRKPAGASLQLVEGGSPFCRIILTNMWGYAAKQYGAKGQETMANPRRWRWRRWSPSCNWRGWELLTAKKRESPGLLSPNTGEAKKDPGSLWGTAFIIFLKVLLSWGLWKLRIISLGYCCVGTMSYALFQLQLGLSAQPWHTLPEARSKHSGNHGKKTGSVYPWTRWWELGWASLTLLGVWLCVLTLPFDTSFPHLPEKAYHLWDLSNLDFLTLAAVEWLSKSLMFYCKQSARTVKVEVMVSLNSFSLSRRLAQKSTMTLITWMKKWGSRSHSL